MSPPPSSWSPARSGSSRTWACWARARGQVPGGRRRRRVGRRVWRRGAGRRRACRGPFGRRRRVRLGVPGAVDEQASGDGQGQQQQDLSKIVRDGRIGIVVADDAFGDAVGELTLIAERYGGFILSSTTNNDRSGPFVLRIPANGSTERAATIRDLGTRVRFEEVTRRRRDRRVHRLPGAAPDPPDAEGALSICSSEADTTDEILRLLRTARRRPSPHRADPGAAPIPERPGGRVDASGLDPGAERPRGHRRATWTTRTWVRRSTWPCRDSCGSSAP